MSIPRFYIVSADHRGDLDTLRLAGESLGLSVPSRALIDQRGQLLGAALGCAGLPHPPYDHALRALRIWLDSWSGIGRIMVGMHRQSFDLQLTQ